MSRHLTGAALTHDPVHSDQVYQLKIGLRGFRPPVWRRVLVPALADLGQLHRVIQAVLAWDDDHLHVFTADSLPYADPYHGLDGCTDEDTVAIATVLPRTGARLDYRTAVRLTGAGRQGE